MPPRGIDTPTVTGGAEGTPMQELRLVAVSEDGSYAVLAAPGSGGRFTLPIDDRLRVVARGQFSRLAQYEIEVESPLRPKEIQDRIRAGETAEEIADAAGLPIERVRRFEGPVLAERAYRAQEAQGAALRQPGDSGPGPRLGEVVSKHLMALGSDPEEADWDSRKRADGDWQVRLTFTTRAGTFSGEWVFDPRRRHISPADETAAQICMPGADLSVFAPDERNLTTATVTPIGSRLGSPDRDAARRPQDRFGAAPYERDPGRREPDRYGEPARFSEPTRYGGPDRVMGPDRVSGPDRASGPGRLAGPDRVSGPARLAGPDRLAGSDRASGPDRLAGPDHIDAPPPYERDTSRRPQDRPAAASGYAQPAAGHSQAAQAPVTQPAAFQAAAFQAAAFQAAAPAPPSGVSRGRHGAPLPREESPRPGTPPPTGAQPPAAAPRAAELRAGEPRAAEPRAGGPPATERRAAEPRAAEPRASEPRAAGPEATAGQTALDQPPPRGEAGPAQAPPAAAEAAPQPEPSPEPAQRRPGRKSARSRRASVPSWDEIMLGTSRPE